MNVNALNQALREVVDKRRILSGMGYDHEQYDDVEEELHDLEDEFLSQYGDFLEVVLQKVHDEHCPESDVLLPTAYLPRQYQKAVNAKTGEEEIELGDNDGVWVDLDAFPGADAKLVLLPDPARIELLTLAGSQTVWKAS
ncbi:MAG: hypothetical protein LH606_11300 [Cytophagaceae bacterium]|nr:hypothetical protein [Cytophagaceae bacterium]